MPAVKTMRVLVVDDERGMRELIARSLRTIGFAAIDVYENGADAFEAMRQAPYQLVISDWMMGGVDGLELLQKVRDDATMRKIPFIMVTGRMDRSFVERASAAGANAWIAKPFRPSILKTMIESVVGALT